MITSADQYEGAVVRPTGRIVQSVVGIFLTEVEIVIPMFHRDEITTEDVAGAARERHQQLSWWEEKPRRSRTPRSMGNPSFPSGSRTGWKGRTKALARRQLSQ
jgi:hypothetical protein